MGNGIYDGLENRRHVVLRKVHSSLALNGGGSHVSGHEAASLGDLTIQRSHNILSVKLIGTGDRPSLNPVAAISDRLNVGAREPVARILSGHQHSGDRGSKSAVFVLPRHAEFAEKCGAVLIRTRGTHSFNEIGRQILQLRPGHRLLVESNQTRLAALLKQPGEILRRHRPF